MYAKTNLTAGRLTRRQKRIFAITALLVVAVFGALAAWGALAHDSYAASGHGCVNVTVPSSTGGSTLHYCGSQARSFCQSAFRSQDQISLRARAHCVQAGLAPESSAADPSPAG
jgi:hypothetical protein